MRFVKIGGNDHALARRQAVGLDDDGCTAFVHILMRGLGIGESLVARGRNAMALHERFGKILGAFELRRPLRRAEYPEARRLECIDYAGGQRRFRADHRQRDRLLARELDEFGVIGNIDVLDAVFERSAGIARRDIHFGYARRLRELPRQCMLATAAAYDH